MKILMMNAGYIGPDYYRVTEPARAVHEAHLGVEVTISQGLTTTMRTPLDGGDSVVTDVDPQGADVVVLQLPKTAEMLQCIRVLQAQGIAVVVEMDDLLSAVPFGNPAHNNLVRRGMARLALQCAREADLVTTTTPALVTEYAPRGRGVVVPNAVPRRIAELPPAYEREPDTVTVGWAGSVPGHPYDLQEMGSGLQQALDNTRGRSRFMILGQKSDARERLRLPEEPAELPWIHDVDGYTTAVGEVFDIGVAPLRIDRFNTCKSWLKSLEYAARGVYCVRSPSAEYERLGLGRRAKAPKDWAKALTTAIRDPDLRRDQAARDRAVVLDRHLTEHTAAQWVAAWERAVDNRARSRRRGA
ncbi:glycosyltransferase [Geodermatophilus sp. SYSU D01106]